MWSHDERYDLFIFHILILWVVQAVDEFVFELAYKENNPKKREKINTLRLNEGEWTRVRLFCNILQVSQRFNIFNLDTNSMGMGLTSVCRWSAVRLLFSLNADAPQRLANFGKASRGLGEGLQQVLLFPFHTSSHRENGQAQCLLPTFGWIGCAHHGNG